MYAHIPANQEQCNCISIFIDLLNLATEDAANDLLFGEIVWRSVRGADSPMPPPVRSAFVFAEVEEGEEGDEEAEEKAEF